MGGEHLVIIYPCGGDAKGMAPQSWEWALEEVSDQALIAARWLHLYFSLNVNEYGSGEAVRVDLFRSDENACRAEVNADKKYVFDCIDVTGSAQDVVNSLLMRVLTNGYEQF